MAYSLSSALVDKVALQINDANKTRWTQAELVSYLNDGIKAVCLRRPDAYTIKGPFTCVAGTEQRLPEDALTLLDVLRNIDGKAIRGPHDTLMLDNYRPDWRLSVDQNEADTYMYDERNPHYFYLYPGVMNTHMVELVYTTLPVELTEADVLADKPIGLDSVYDNPVMDWMIYRAFNKDAEYTANSQRAQLALNAFKTAIGEKNQADNATYTSNLQENKKMK